MKSVLKFILIIFVILPFAAYTFWYYATEIAPFWGKDFNQKEWNEAFNFDPGHGSIYERSEKKRAECIRGAMFGDLKKNYLKIGIPKSKVLELLGPAMHSYQGKSDEGYPLDVLEYDIGECSGFEPDLDELHIYFDKNQNIIEVKHVFHSV